MSFLTKLYTQKNLIKHAKVVALTWDELPLETIEGRFTQGSINFDGASAVRRTCNITLVANNFNYNDYLWSIKTKFKLYIGLENHIDDTREPIIWFPQGIYVLTTFNTSRSTNNFTIQISGKDKMCLLNGEIGGNLESEIDFGTIEQEDQDGNWVIDKIPLKDIIFNAVNVYGKEPKHNIFIKDLDAYGLELLEYRYDEPIYLVRQNGANNYFNAYYDKECEVNGENTSLSKVNNDQFEILLQSGPDSEGADFRFDNDESQSYKVAKIEYGDCAGYRTTDLVFAGDLIAKAGESLTSILDKIRNMLVEFEYFYDVDGHFIFQKKPSYTNAIWSFPTDENSKTIVPALQEKTFEYEDLSMITSLGYNPNIANLKNDFSIWGERTTASGAKVPIHLRYAIDVRPQEYTSIAVENEELIAYNKKYGTVLAGQTSITYSAQLYDWREIIYQMAEDYFKYNHLHDFLNKVSKANPTLYPSGYTGYEQYYTDIQGFWRELYNPFVEEEQEELNNNISQFELEMKEKQIEIDNKNQNFKTLEQKKKAKEADIAKALEASNNVPYIVEEIKRLDADIVRKEMIIDAYVRGEPVPEEYNSPEAIDELRFATAALKEAMAALDMQYKNYMDINQNVIIIYSDIDNIEIDLANILKAEQTEYYNLTKEAINVSNEIEALEQEAIVLQEKINQCQNQSLYLEETYNDTGWCKALYEQPDTLNFWFDLFEGTISMMKNFGVKNIGSRPKVVNETSINSIYYRETPNVIYVEALSEEDIVDGRRYIQIPNIEEMFSISAQGKSAKERLDELVFQHLYCTENANITSIPLYHLQPNSRIKLNDADTGLSGEYLVSKLTIPLAYNGTMSITAAKINE